MCRTTAYRYVDSLRTSLYVERLAGKSLRFGLPGAQDVLLLAAPPLWRSRSQRKQFRRVEEEIVHNAQRVLQLTACSAMLTWRGDRRVQKGGSSAALVFDLT